MSHLAEHSILAVLLLAVALTILFGGDTLISSERIKKRADLTENGLPSKPVPRFNGQNGLINGG